MNYRAHVLQFNKKIFLRFKIQRRFYYIPNTIEVLFSYDPFNLRTLNKFCILIALLLMRCRFSVQVRYNKKN